MEENMRVMSQIELARSKGELYALLRAIVSELPALCGRIARAEGRPCKPAIDQ
jgi:hypothetical protein